MKLLYNNIAFVNSHQVTLRYDEEPQRSQDGSYLYTQYTIGVRGIINKDCLPEGVPFSSADPATVLRWLEARLHVTGAPLQFISDTGEVIIETPQPNAGTGALYDDVRGPRPTRVRVGNFAPDTYTVDFEVVVGVSPCGNSGVPPNILRNFWEMSTVWDENLYATHTVRGQIITSGRADASVLNFSDLVIPGRLINFRRVNYEYVVSSDGTTCNYSFQDKQEYILPPKPATRAKGAYSEVYRGINTVAQLDIQLQGPPAANRGTLVSLATRTALAYMTGGTGIWDSVKGNLVDDPVITSGVWDNSIQMRVRWLKTKTAAFSLVAAGTEGVEVLRKIITDTRSLDPSVTAFDVKTLHSSLKRFVCSDDQNKAVPNGTILTFDVDQVDPQDDIVTVSEVDYLLRSPTFESTEQLNANYSDNRMDSGYIERRHVYAFPKASANTGDETVTMIEPSKPSYVRVVRYNAERPNQKPVMPGVSTDTNEVIVRHGFTSSAPSPTAGGFSRNHRADSSSTYFLEKRPTAFRTGTLPATNFAHEEYNENDFQAIT